MVTSESKHPTNWVRTRAGTTVRHEALCGLWESSRVAALTSPGQGVSLWAGLVHPMAQKQGRHPQHTQSEWEWK